MNVSPHRQAILVFGVVLPLFVILVIAMGTFLGHSNLKRDFQFKMSGLERYETAKSQAAELETMLTTDNRRDKIIYWNSKLEQDVVQSLTQNLNKILAKYDSDILRQTEMGQASGAGGIGTRANHPHSRMQLSFEGSFKPMQLLLAELENEMPHLLLESITMRALPSTSDRDRGILQFGVVYLCWEKPKA